MLWEVDGREASSISLVGRRAERCGSRTGGDGAGAGLRVRAYLSGERPPGTNQPWALTVKVQG